MSNEHPPDLPLVPSAPPSNQTVTMAPSAAASVSAPNRSQDLKMLGAGIGGVLALFLISWLTWPSQAPTVEVVTPPKLQEKPPESPLFTNSPTNPTNNTEVVLQLKSTPANARVLGFVAGEAVEVGPTPSELRVPKGAQVELTFVSSGYTPQQKVITAEKDQQEINVTLTEQGKKPSGRSGGFR